LEKHNIPKPDVIIADPPRAGMNPKTVNDILKLEPEKIVYVSCNPSTQARDIKLLCEEKYELIKIQPVDMFPQTFHIENVALLLKK
jgi:23S rRNA (uracil1939-C5)-methyltransferase